MNQGYGLRFYYLNKESFKHIKFILEKIEIYNTDYKEIFSKFPNAFYFLDPPYFSQNSSYEAFSLNEYKIFLDLIQDKEYIYTDIINDYNKNISETKIFLRQMNKTAPATKQQTSNKEYLFTTLSKYNFDINSLF
jgi:site-specific DNA-adenine methylase